MGWLRRRARVRRRSKTRRVVEKISEMSNGNPEKQLEEEKAIEVFVAIAAEKGIPATFAEEDDLETIVTEAVRCAYVLFSTGDGDFGEEEPAAKKRKTGAD